MAQDALDDILLVDERNDALPVSTSGTAAVRPHTFMINSRHFLEGMRRGSWAETSITSTASPSACASSSACLARRPRVLLEYHPY